MPQYCSKCCEDLDLDLKELLFPEFYLDADGQYFLEVHGLSQLTVEELRQCSTTLENGKVKIRHRCHQLDAAGLCTIYSNRPKLCRDYQCESRRVMVVADRCETERRYIPMQVVHG